MCETEIGKVFFKMQFSVKYLPSLATPHPGTDDVLQCPAPRGGNPRSDEEIEMIGQQHANQGEEGLSQVHLRKNKIAPHAWTWVMEDKAYTARAPHVGTVSKSNANGEHILAPIKTKTK